MLFSPSLIFYYVELHWPLNYHLSFELCFIVAIAVLLISLVLPKAIEKKGETLTTLIITNYATCIVLKFYVHVLEQIIVSVC